MKNVKTIKAKLKNLTFSVYILISFDILTAHFISLEDKMTFENI